MTPNGSGRRWRRSTGAAAGWWPTEVGEAPAHVMTRTDTDQVHVTLNGKTRSWNSAGARKGSIAASPSSAVASWPANPTPTG